MPTGHAHAQTESTEAAQAGAHEASAGEAGVSMAAGGSKAQANSVAGKGRATVRANARGKPQRRAVEAVPAEQSGECFFNVHKIAPNQI